MPDKSGRKRGLDPHAFGLTATRSDQEPATMSFAYNPTAPEVRRRSLPASRAVSARPALTAFDRARIEGLIARLIDLLDACDAPSAELEPDWDNEADADAERSLQPVTLTPYAEHRPQPFPGWAALEAAGLAAPPAVSCHDEAKPRLAEGKVVSHRRGSKPRRTVIEGEVAR